MFMKMQTSISKNDHLFLENFLEAAFKKRVFNILSKLQSTKYLNYVKKTYLNVKIRYTTIDT